MIIVSSNRGNETVAPAVRARALFRRARIAAVRLIAAGALFGASLSDGAWAQEPSQVEERIRALVPDLEATISAGMKTFDVPGLAIGIVAGDKLLFAKGSGVRSKGGEPVDTRTVFQIGSTTKAFLATTMAIMADRG